MNFLDRDISPTNNVISSIVNHIHEETRNLPQGGLAGKGLVSLESITDHERRALTETGSMIQVALEGLRNTLQLSGEYTPAQKDAAEQAGLMATNWNGLRDRTLRDALPKGAVSVRTVAMESYGFSTTAGERSYAKESYDERDNRSAVAYSITYNLQSARQDDFGETLFPTITIPADQMGVTITANLLFVMDNVDRDVNGLSYDLKRKNVLRAVADATVLRKEQTRAVPVWTSQSEAAFVATGTLPTKTVDIDGTDIVTSALLFGSTVDLLGISQTDAMLALGTQNQTDTLDPMVEIQDFYVSSLSQNLMFTTQNLPYFNFVPNAQGDYKLLTLNAETNSILLNDQTLNAAGGALTGALGGIATNHWTVRCRVVMTGSVRTDTGNIQVYGNTFSVYSITDVNGVSIALTDSSVASLVAALNATIFLGYEPLAYRSNQNRRQQGQFVDVAKEYQRYLVPLRSPITARHPAHIDGQVDASDVQALITTTRIRIANEAVTSILQSADLLAAYSDVRDTSDEGPDVLGVGRYYVRPTYIARPFDASTMIDSLKSHERAEDIQMGIINEIRDMVYTLYRDSEYKAAADALAGGVGPIPTVVLATDPYTARYLTVTGDLRTLGGEFNFHVVSTLDTRFRGTIVITFAVMDEQRNVSINPLNNGNLLWAPELVLTANIGRGGQYSRETLVQPRYRFIQNLPVMGVLTVTNIPDALGKIPLDFVDVTP